MVKGKMTAGGKACWESSGDMLSKLSIIVNPFSNTSDVGVDLQIDR